MKRDNTEVINKNEVRNKRRKANYEMLRKYGYTREEATKLKDRSKRFLRKLISDRVAELQNDLMQMEE